MLDIFKRRAELHTSCNEDSAYIVRKHNFTLFDDIYDAVEWAKENNIKLTTLVHQGPRRVTRHRIS